MKNISLEIKDGEFLGLMGPNGSGKTTLLRCIMRYLTPEDGAVLIDSTPLHTMKEKELARLFAVVPQSSNLDFSFTAYDIVMMGRLPYANSRFMGESESDAQAVREAMERTDTWKFSTRPFNSLSGGERQRVIIARALAQKPRILLLDEPTVFLDLSGQFEIMDLLRDLNREGLTIIAVLHDINLASRYCERIALLNEGRLESLGTPDQVFTPENIMRIYDLDVIVRRDPVTNSISVVPKSACIIFSSSERPRVHVLCGGGSGGEIMRLLLDEGYSVSAGVVNVLDSDFESAKALHIPVVMEVPFAQIGDEAHAQNLRAIESAEAVVLSDFPVGPGNLRNLEAAAWAQENEKKVFIIDPENAEKRDFTGGRAKDIIGELLRHGAIGVRRKAELVSALRKEKKIE